MKIGDLQSILDIGNEATRLERERCIAICDEAIGDAVVSRYGFVSDCNAAREMAERIKSMIEEGGS